MQGAFRQLSIFTEAKLFSDAERAKARVEQRISRPRVYSFYVSTFIFLSWNQVAFLAPYSSRFPTTFFLFSSSLNHSLSIHSVHFLPSLELVIQITLWPSTSLISSSSFRKMAVRVPSIHSLWRGSLFSLKAHTESSSSFWSETTLAFAGMKSCVMRRCK